MADPLSEDDILEAVAQHTARPGQGSHLRRTGATVSSVPMLNLRIVRSVVSRTKESRRKPGRFDVSDRITYEGDLDGYQVDPPKDPAQRQKTKLVQSGSVKSMPCTCDGGRRPCSRCSESGQLPCDPGSKCPECQGVDPCTWCDGTGKPPPGPAKKAPAPGHPSDRSTPDVARTTCLLCRRPGTACPTCRGQGFKNCPRCKGKGSRDCPNCAGKGSKKHEECDGTGTWTVWTEGLVEHTPQRVSLTLPKPQLSPRVRQRTARSGAWDKVTLSAAGDTMPDGLDPTHLKAVDAALAPHPDEAARRAEISWLPLATVTLPEDPGHIFFVFPGKQELEVLTVWSRDRTLHVTAAAAVAFTVLVLLLALLT
jgi:hypothetical protein